ncbi:MAG TPA: DUF445 family protein [Gemmatimonadales bacterium]|nr:DUF445 family protein [Gemmatimonadales bacterium]
MDHQTLLSAVFTIGGGILSGGITNAVAIWMLFHPYERRGIGPFVIQGAIPKNKARLAKAIGRTVGDRLLTAEDLTGRLSTPAARETFAGALDGILGDMLAREGGPLRARLSPALVRSLDETTDEMAPRFASALARYAASPGFETLATNWLTRLRADLDGKPIGAALTEPRRAALRDAVDGWVAQLTEGEELEAALRHFVRDRLDHLAADNRPLLDRLPPGVVDAVEQAISDYLPVALERLGALLADPGARQLVEDALRDAFDQAVRDLLLHERLLARLVVTDRTIERLVDGFERDGFDRFALAVSDPAMKAHVSRAVNEAVVRFLRRPLGERLRAMSPARRDALAATVGDWIVRVTREPATRAVIARTLGRVLDAAEGRTWGELLGVVPPAQVAGLMGEALAGAEGQASVVRAVRQIADHLLDRPLGQGEAWLEADTGRALRRAVADAAWEGVQQQVPRIVEQLDVHEMVEQKVLGFSTERMEEIVRTVTQRELDLIVQLGYVLGGIVGLFAFLVNLAVR